MRVAITGASGLVGSELVAQLGAEHEITRVVRRRERAKRGAAYWNPDTGEVDAHALEGHDVVVHLAGESLFGVWTRRRRETIRRSRVQGTQLLASALAALERPPALLVTASAVGFYGDRPTQPPLDEQAGAGAGFLAGVVRSWEAANEPAEVAGIRTVQLRLGLILSERGGIVRTMLPAFRLGLGAVIGPGTQAWSWIALAELPPIVRHVIATPSLRGPVNATAPEAVTSAEFSQALGNALHRPVPIRVPAALVRLAPGGMGRELALASARVAPAKLLATGYRFRHPALEPLLRELVGRGADSASFAAPHRRG
jgi:uncharacterized protein (TIGR01777 family)